MDIHSHATCQTAAVNNPALLTCFAAQVHKCVSQGGKVLVPVFAVGRAQELLMLVEEYWERMGLKV